MTEEQLAAFAHLMAQQKYLQTEPGRQARVRDRERWRQGYQALRERGLSSAEAKRHARQASRELEVNRGGM